MSTSGCPPFLASEIPDLPPERCLFHVLPAPLESTVSYGGGTAKGPEAILYASQQLEAWDGQSCPCEAGIHTLAPAGNLEAITAATSRVFQTGHIPVVLGGEHTVTVGAVRGIHSLRRDFGVIQFDAHADLRQEYEGSRLSHACVMARMLEMELPILQIGVRALSQPEAVLRREKMIPHLDARRIASGEKLVIPPDFPQDIYLTFDIDALDSALMPATGTPQPGGLLWWQTITLLEEIAARHTIIGFDVVELAPIPGLHECDFTAALLTYAIMGMITRQRENSPAPGNR